MRLVHFGRKQEGETKVKPYLPRKKWGYVSLQQTVKKIDETYEVVIKICAGKVFICGTKKQAQDAVEFEAKKADNTTC